MRRLNKSRKVQHKLYTETSWLRSENCGSNNTGCSALLKLMTCLIVAESTEHNVKEANVPEQESIARKSIEPTVCCAAAALCSLGILSKHSDLVPFFLKPVPAHLGLPGVVRISLLFAFGFGANGLQFPRCKRMTLVASVVRDTHSAIHQELRHWSCLWRSLFSSEHCMLGLPLCNHFQNT